MTKFKLNAALTAIFLGTAGAAIAVAAPVHAATVSAKVGAALKEAQVLAAAGNYRAAMAKINEADSAPGRTPEEGAIISQMKQYVGVKSGDVGIGGAAAARAKFANDYNAGRYREVIADAELLRRNNALDANAQLVIAQAYYKSGDFAGCVRYTKSFGGDTALELQARCAYETGDVTTQRRALEALVARSGKPEYWKSLLKLSERSQGMTDHNMLDINRIRMMTGNVVTRDEYTLLAQLALQLGNPAEAQGVLEKGVTAKVLTDARSARLLTMARTQAVASAANEGKLLAAAKAAPQGDLLVKLGEDQIGRGNAKGAIATIQAGLNKPLKDEANARIRLGQAYLAAGRKSDAQAAFASVKAPQASATVARLWALVARGKTGV